MTKDGVALFRYFENNTSNDEGVEGVARNLKGFKALWEAITGSPPPRAVVIKCNKILRGDEGIQYVNDENGEMDEDGESDEGWRLERTKIWS